MEKIVQDFWIITESGIDICHRVYDPKLESQLFSMLMSALDSFAKELMEEGLTNFELSNKRFSLVKKNNLLFIASSKKKIKEKKVLIELNYIIEKFFNLYPKEIFNNWDGNIDMFFGFEKEIEETLENRVEKFWVGF